jgi:hypothetical protein
LDLAGEPFGGAAVAAIQGFAVSSLPCGSWNCAKEPKKIQRNSTLL